MATEGSTGNKGCIGIRGSKGAEVIDAALQNGNGGVSDFAGPTLGGTFRMSGTYRFKSAKE